MYNIVEFKQNFAKIKQVYFPKKFEIVKTLQQNVSNRVVFQLSQSPNIPKKWFIAQKGPLDIRSHMRQTPTIEPQIYGKIRQNPW